MSGDAQMVGCEGTMTHGPSSCQISEVRQLPQRLKKYNVALQPVQFHNTNHNTADY